MIRKFIIPILVCLLLLPGICLAQSQTKKDKDDEVTPKEKRELLRLSKLFVRRYQQTRDLKPLLNEFFLKDFISYFDQDNMSRISPELWSKLTKGEKIRDFVAYFNLLYVVEVAMLQEKPDSIVDSHNLFAALFPESIAKKFNGLNIEGWNGEAITDRQELVKWLSALEQVVTEARAYIQKKNYERSSEFRKNLLRLAKDKKLGYLVVVVIEDEGIRKKGSKDLRVFPPGVKIYAVTTPFATILQFVKVKGLYKIIAITIYDD